MAQKQGLAQGGRIRFRFTTLRCSRSCALLFRLVGAAGMKRPQGVAQKDEAGGLAEDRGEEGEACAATRGALSALAVPRGRPSP